MHRKIIISILLPICLTFLVITTTDADEKEDGIDLTSENRALLQKEMNLIQNAMCNLIASISQEDWKTTAETGKKIADSFILKQGLNQEHMNELHQSYPEGFNHLDYRFHRLAEKLSKAASEHDQELVSFYFSGLANSCIDCHSRYANQRFTGFRSEPQTKHITHDIHAHHDHHEASHANQHMYTHDFEALVQRFEDPKREEWQKPELVVRKLGDLSEKTIADIGAGTGYFSFRLAKKAKKVIALDLDQRFLDYIDTKNKSLTEELPIETRMASPKDPNLILGEADIVLIVNTYHHIENRIEYFSKMRNKIGQDIALVIVDFKKEEMPVGPPLRIKLSEITVVNDSIEEFEI